MGLLRRIHTAILAWFEKRYRIQEVVKVLKAAHALELKQLPYEQWPQMQAKQEHELAAVRAGKLDIVDRKSWQWPFLPASIQRLSVPVIKTTPYNLRRMSRTPIPRRAINLIKNTLISLPWDIRPIQGVEPKNEADQLERIDVAKKLFHHPNNDDSFQTWIEQGTEDYLCFGGFVFESALTFDIERPLKLWAVNIESVRIFASWSESTPDMPRYAQMTGLRGERGAILFYDDNLTYLKDNPSTDSPFGLGKMEIAFQSINDFLGVQGMAGRAGSDQIHKTWLWWEQPQTDAAFQIVRRHIQNELEGQAKVSLIGGMKKPEVIDVNPVVEADLLLNWQEMLIRMVAAAFDMSAMSFIEHDINRAVGEVLADNDFRSAVVPTAKRYMEAFTRKVLHRRLGWTDLEFVFNNLEDPDMNTKIDILSRMYSMNAVTPNEIRIKMGEQKKDDPIYDLSQAEMMLLNIDATTKAAMAQQDHSATIQQGMMDHQSELQQQNQVTPPVDMGSGSSPQQSKSPAQKPQSSGVEKTTPSNLAKGGQPPSPKPLSLPKYPIASSRYSAKKIMQMPVNQLSDLYSKRQDPFHVGKVSQLLSLMDEQEPGFLDQMEEEARDFFVHLLDEEEKQSKKKKVPAKMLKDRAARLRKDKLSDDKRDTDFGKYLYEHGEVWNKISKSAGKPGNLNPIKRS